MIDNTLQSQCAKGSAEEFQTRSSSAQRQRDVTSEQPAPLQIPNVHTHKHFTIVDENLQWSELILLLGSHPAQTILTLECRILI